MSSCFSLVSLKNIHNLCFATFSFRLLRVLQVGTLSSSIESSPSSEGVLTVSSGFSEGNRCSSIDRRWRLSIAGGLCLLSDIRLSMSINGCISSSSDSKIIRAGRMWVFRCELLVSQNPYSIARCG
ncbi:hypothetical protein F2Q69_00006644 [Brassica cretica]|uniref:Uncharacterized protein n=1 Tax=Brassica cretica TaxID=69181 RepID=A0A8S9PG50_BRACR|nr:hypothetical protein F2Q69_00006644 [Brassica cretica]